MEKFAGFKGLITVLSLVAAFGTMGCNSDSKSSTVGITPSGEGDGGDSGKRKNPALKCEAGEKLFNPMKTPTAPIVRKIASCETGTFPEGNGIINGQPIHPAFEVVPSIVRIYSIHSDGVTVCTGTLLDSDTVLTAAHCVNDLYSAENIRVHFHHDPSCEPGGLLDDSRDQNTPYTEANMRRASAFVIHAKYSTSYLINDIALIKLRTSAPTSARPVSIASWEVTSTSTRAKVLAVGYGKVGRYDVQDNNHRLRYGWVKPLTEEARREKLVGSMRQQGLGDADRAYVDKNWLFFDQADANGVCAGDSGGPAFVKIDGRWSQVGVASFVANVSPGGGEVCKDIGAHVNLDAHREWMRAARCQLLNETGRSTY